MTHNTREAWLEAVADDIITNVLAPAGYATHAETGSPLSENIRISTGWPSTRGTAAKGRALGQTFSTKVSTDGTAEIFISPYVDDPMEVAATLTHELIHASVGVDKGHTGPFKAAARLVGLTGPMTATEAGERLASILADIVANAGFFPHAKLDVTNIRKQTTRNFKVECVNPECPYLLNKGKAYKVNMSMEAYSVAAPICGVCETRMTAGSSGEEPIAIETEEPEEPRLNAPVGLMGIDAFKALAAIEPDFDTEDEDEDGIDRTECEICGVERWAHGASAAHAFE